MNGRSPKIATPRARAALRAFSHAVPASHCGVLMKAHGWCEIATRGIERAGIAPLQRTGPLRPRRRAFAIRKRTEERVVVQPPRLGRGKRRERTRTRCVALPFHGLEDLKGVSEHLFLEPPHQRVVHQTRSPHVARADADRCRSVIVRRHVRRPRGPRRSGCRSDRSPWRSALNTATARRAPRHSAAAAAGRACRRQPATPSSHRDQRCRRCPSCVSTDTKRAGREIPVRRRDGMFMPAARSDEAGA